MIEVDICCWKATYQLIQLWRELAEGKNIYSLYFYCSLINHKREALANPFASKLSNYQHL